MTDEPTVLFCVGATKAGTSWLHRFLSDHPDCHLRSIKELHYFDGTETAQRDAQIARLRDEQLQLSARIDGANKTRAANILRQIGDREHWLDVLQSDETGDDAYLEYLMSDRHGEKLVADMTPAYSLLGQEQLVRMAAIRPDTKFIYLLRDPIARLWSHVRMIAARRDEEGELHRNRADRIFERVIDGQETQISLRSDYRGAIERLRAAVDPARLLFVFHEDLFDGEAVARICEFLGIARRKANRDRKVHAGQPLMMRDDQRKRARLWLAEQYDYVRATLGQPPAAWQYDLAKVQA